MVCLSVDCWKVGIIEELIDCIYGVSECGLLEGWHHGGVDQTVYMVCLNVDCWKVGIIQELIDCIYGVS